MDDRLNLILTYVPEQEYYPTEPFDATYMEALIRDKHAAESLRIDCEGMESHPEMERV